MKVGACPQCGLQIDLATAIETAARGMVQTGNVLTATKRALDERETVLGQREAKIGEREAKIGERENKLLIHKTGDRFSLLEID